MRRASETTRLLLAGALFLTMAGCADLLEFGPPEEDSASLPVRYVITVQAPPAALAEPVPWPSRTPERIWRPGYWVFDGASFEWVSGGMIDRPSPTAVWSPDRWVKRAYGWGFVSGYWQ